MEDFEIAEKLINYEIKLLSASYEKMTSYTNLIIVAGYASFFGIHQMTKDYLTPWQTIWSAMFMLMSIFIFVFFEIAKTLKLERQNSKLRRILFNNESKKTLQSMVDAHKKFEIEETKNRIMFNKFWLCTYVPTVAFGILGSGILAVAFICKLLN